MVVSVLWAPPLHAGSRTFVEMGDTGGRVDEALVRRLIALELGDVTVPANPRFPGDLREDVVLHCRVVPDEGGLRVEVWERGDAAGARRVSLQGSSQLVARRVALAAAELARRLARDRIALQKRMEREARAEEERASDRAKREEQRRLALSARAKGVAFFEGAYLLGPELGVQLNHEYPLRIEMGLGWLGGSVSALSPAAGWSAAEFSLSPAYVFPKSGWELALRVPLTATLLHMRDGVNVDDISGEHDTWTARAGLGIAAQPRVASHLRLDLGLSAGLLMRPVPLSRIQDGADEAERFGGGFAELTLGVLLD